MIQITLPKMAKHTDVFVSLHSNINLCNPVKHPLFKQLLFLDRVCVSVCSLLIFFSV